MYFLLFFLGVLLLPVIGVVIIANTGLEAVSNHLVDINAKTHKIELHLPNGQLYKTLSIETVWPVKGVVTLEFGQSDLPYQPLHTGIDIANAHGKVGDEIVCAMSGIVTYAGEINWGYGRHVVVDNGDNITTTYGHLNTIDVKKGDKCEVGKTVLGTEGQTGWATGPHLHFEVDFFGVPVNPRIFIYDYL